MNKILLSLILICTAACQPLQTSPEIEHINSPELAALKLPLSQAVRVGNTFYLSGQLGNKPGTKEIVPGGIGPETEQAITNMKEILESNGLGLENVVKCTVIVADIKDYAELNKAYRKHFSTNPPARSIFAENDLVLGAKVALDCIAVAD